MQVELNEKNIDKYKLVELTGNDREFLLEKAAEAVSNGHTISVNVPDEQVETENVFDIYESEHVDPRRLQHCGYEDREDEKGNHYLICLLHGKTSRHDLNVNPTAPCLVMDPDPQAVFDAMREMTEKKEASFAPKIGSICTYAKKDSPTEGTTYVCKIHGRPSKHDISRLPNQPCLSVDPRQGFEETN